MASRKKSKTKRWCMNLLAAVLLISSFTNGVWDALSRGVTAAKTIYASLPVWTIYLANPLVVSALTVGALVLLLYINRNMPNKIKIIVQVFVVALVISLILALSYWNLIQPTIHAPFAPLYERNRKALGSALKPAQPQHTEYAAHENAVAVWFINDPGMYVLDPDHKWTQSAGIFWDSNPKWTDREWLRKRFNLTPDCEPPYSGVATLWARDEKWKRMGCRVFECSYISNDVYYQEFEHGIIIGPFLMNPANESWHKVETFALIRDSNTTREGVYDPLVSDEPNSTKLPKCTENPKEK